MRSFSIFNINRTNTSIFVSLLIFILFTFAFYNRVSDVIKSNDPKCLTAYDGFGYYSYLPALFIENDLAFENWPEQLQEKYCKGSPVYQFHPLPNGSKLNIYHMGLAYTELPSFLIAHAVAKMTEYSQDGMSKPYHIAFFLNALLFIVIGIFYVRKLLLLFFDDHITSLTLIAIYLGTNVFMNFYIEPSLSHLYLFTINAAFVYHAICFQRNSKKKDLLISALLFGLTTAIRPTQVIWGIIPFFLLFKNNRMFWPSIKILLLYPLFSLIWNIPQFLYWKYYGDSWFMVNLHNESIVLSDPKVLDFLFSFKKGWLLYTPVFLMIPFGIKTSFKREGRLVSSIILLTLFSIYIFSSWECWWFAESFGSRVMQEIYPVLGILIGFVMFSIRQNKIYKIIILTVFILLLFLNIVQSIQFKNGIISGSRNTKDHYLEYFGVINTEGYDQSLLEMDRSDTSWLSSVIIYDKSLSNQKGYSIQKKVIPLPELNVSFNEKDEYKGDLSKTIMYIVPTDEARFSFSWNYQSSDTTNSPVLVFVIENEYNAYNYIVSDLKANDPTKNLTFNLPNIRHATDQMTMYVWNPKRISGKLSNVQLTIDYLNRNN